MTVELKKRIITSITLFLLLIFIFLNEIILLSTLIVLTMLASLEFFNLMKKILNKKKYLQLIFNSIFVIYIFIYSCTFYLFTGLLQLKILIFLSLIFCISSDIGGLIFGRIFKGPKLTKISPNKTYAGSLGSFLFTIMIALLFSYFISDIFVLHRVIILALFVSFGCQVGDIFFSYLKRKAKLKDTGSILPGHGGILDRIDGILLGLPLGIIITLFLYNIVS